MASEQLERERLIGDVSENLGKLISSVNQLNRRIESTVTVGSQFESASRLWKEYQRVLGADAASGERVTTELETVNIDEADETILGGAVGMGTDESFGLAPGAGSRSYVQ